MAPWSAAPIVYIIISRQTAGRLEPRSVRGLCFWKEVFLHHCHIVLAYVECWNVLWRVRHRPALFVCHGTTFDVNCLYVNKIELSWFELIKSHKCLDNLFAHALISCYFLCAFMCNLQLPSPPCVPEKLFYCYVIYRYFKYAELLKELLWFFVLICTTVDQKINPTCVCTKVKWSHSAIDTWFILSKTSLILQLYLYNYTNYIVCTKTNCFCGSSQPGSTLRF